MPPQRHAQLVDLHDANCNLGARQCQNNFALNQHPAGTECKGVPNTVRELIQRAIKEAGSQTELAERIGIDDSTVSKIARGVTSNLDWTTLLRLSAVLKMSPSDVLRIAGKGDIAELIEDYYGEPKTVPAVVRAFAAVTREEPRFSPEERKHFQALAEGFVQDLREVRELLLLGSAGGNAPPDDVAEDGGMPPNQLPRAR
jgi:DNA-binding Xre family transcriptional regulator